MRSLPRARYAADALLSVAFAPACAACDRVLEAPLDGPVCGACWSAVQPIVNADTLALDTIHSWHAACEY